MKFGKLLLAIVGATVLLGALSSVASARNFSISPGQEFIVLFRRLNFGGGIGGTVECEVLLSGTLHARTIAKEINSLIGYITSSTVLRCIRGSATVTQASLPWHRRYCGFTGILPNITTTTECITGAEYVIREPFGATCTVRRETSVSRGINTITAGVVTRTESTGSSRCTASGFEFNGTLSGSETNILTRLREGVRITVTLI
jgi:hypothetical protein